MWLFPRKRRKQAPRDRTVLIQALAQARTAKQRLDYWIRRIESEGGDPKLLETLYFVDYMLEAIILRLNTLIMMDSISGALSGLPVVLAREVARHIETLPPEIAASLSAMSNMLAESHLAEAGLIYPEEVNETARNVIREAARAAAEKARRRGEASIA